MLKKILQSWKNFNKTNLGNSKLNLWILIITEIHAIFSQFHPLEKGKIVDSILNSLFTKFPRLKNLPQRGLYEAIHATIYAYELISKIK